ncbi:hypothetical protein M8C21_011219 [Ambrosia artemisiifolia]|uniref:Fructose-bisphosphate aldolase n=1 Tax=Ambrosia artemisiifolia TaxID=4212 RepID=A0AAD5G7F4_AMBAR|nr:hypothetical protein M8C21_011219 [Ambrosia artemisiifolia]
MWVPGGRNMKKFSRTKIHPGALKQGGTPLVACCIFAAEQATVPVTVHFDHGSSKQELMEVLELGIDSGIVDSSHLPFKENISYTKYISSLAHAKDCKNFIGRSLILMGEIGGNDYNHRLSSGIPIDEIEKLFRAKLLLKPALVSAKQLLILAAQAQIGLAHKADKKNKNAELTARKRPQNCHTSAVKISQIPTSALVGPHNTCLAESGLQAPAPCLKSNPSMSASFRN